MTDGFAPVPLMVNGFDGSGVTGLPVATRELIARREAALGGAYRLFYDEPVEFVRGLGVHLYDPDGVAYLDAYNNVPSVGHSHPGVTEAVARQLATLNTHTRYLTNGTSATPSGCSPRTRSARPTPCSPAPGARRTTWRCASPGSTPAVPG